MMVSSKRFLTIRFAPTLTGETLSLFWFRWAPNSRKAAGHESGCFWLVGGPYFTDRIRKKKPGKAPSSPFGSSWRRPVFAHNLYKDLNIMEYKGYTGTIEPDEESGVLFGRVIGLRDVITFQGDTVPELIKAFQDSVDDYLAFCAERNESPEKTYSGQFVLRLNPELHRELARLARRSR